VGGLMAGLMGLGAPMGGSAWRATAALQLQPAEGDRAASVVCMQVKR